MVSEWFRNGFGMFSEVFRNGFGMVSELFRNRLGIVSEPKGESIVMVRARLADPCQVAYSHEVKNRPCTNTCFLIFWLLAGSGGAFVSSRWRCRAWGDGKCFPGNTFHDTKRRCVRVFFVNSLRAAGVVKKVFVQKNDIRISSSIVSGNSRRLPFTRGHMRSPTGG